MTGLPSNQVCRLGVPATTAEARRLASREKLLQPHLLWLPTDWDYYSVHPCGTVVPPGATILLHQAHGALGWLGLSSRGYLSVGPDYILCR